MALIVLKGQRLPFFLKRVEASCIYILKPENSAVVPPDRLNLTKAPMYSICKIRKPPWVSAEYLG